MPKPSEIFDTPEATGFSRVGGNEEMITEIVERVRFVEFLHGVPVELPSETKELLRSGIRKALTTKDQEKEEAVKAERQLIVDSLLKYQSESGNSYIDIEWFTKVLLALPTEDNK